MSQAEDPSVSQGDEKRQKELVKRAEDIKKNHNVESAELSGRPTDFSCWLCCGCLSIANNKDQAKPESYVNENDNINTNIGDSKQSGNTEACESESKVCTDKQSDEHKPIEDTTEAPASGVGTVVDSQQSGNTEADESDSKVSADKQSDEHKQIGSPSEAPASKVKGLLASVSPLNRGKRCLVLDLDETLVHTSLQPIDCSFAITMQLDGARYGVSVLKRPFVDEFIEECAKLYELVIFTASPAEYANPVIDRLDRKSLIKHRLFGDSCVIQEETKYVKDLSRLGRDLKDCIIIDNNPNSYLFHPTNAIGCTSWFGDKSDTELRDLLPVLRGQLLTVNDVRTILDAGSQSCEWLIKNYGDTTEERESIITE